MNIPSREIVNRLRNEYPAGTRIKLIGMDDVQAPPIGTLGTVKGVNDMSSIRVHWDTGSSLSLVYDIDLYEKV